MLNWQILLSATVLIADFAIRISVALRIVMRRRPLGDSLAWIVIVLLIPFAGAVLYLVVGESRLGSRRARAALALDPILVDWVTDLAAGCKTDWTECHRDAAELARLVRATLHAPPLEGNLLELFHDTEATLRALIDDINTARETVALEYYIWSPGGTVDDLATALQSAVARGVQCRVLVDAVGSRQFLDSAWLNRLREAGVEVVACLPVGLIRSFAVRIDLRNHRKIAIVDGCVAYTGSLNLADPQVFKQNAKVGRWIDATVRITGPVVEVLSAVFELDWHLETSEPIARKPIGHHGCGSEMPGRSTAQVLPSGPGGGSPHAIQQVVLTAIYAAHEELIISSPYFVPDEPTLRALASAAYGGVRVVLIVPARIDHPMVALACRASYIDLLEAGVEIWEFEAGLLHSKTIVVDRSIAFIGSLNMDMRSFWLNFEITLAVYEQGFAEELRVLQESYIEDSRQVSFEDWQHRSFARRLLENSVRLAGPVL
ncbi:MAG: cardiolipin synthase [bacterium]|nr:cardiolipin synthase [bacterium]